MDLIALLGVADGQRAELGNKAWNLRRLHALGLRVPDGFVLPHGYLRELLVANGKLPAFEQLVAGAHVLNRFEKLRVLITGLQFPPRQRDLLGQLLRRLGGCVAVRSSAADEDRQGQSAAGVYQSFTNIASEAALLDSVLRCFAAAFAPAVYLHTRHFGAGTAVIIQRYLEFGLGGVAFSRDPLTGADDIVICVGSHGIEAITDGSASGEVARFARASVPAGAAGLAAAELRELADALARAEALFGCAADVEWGFAQGALYVVQARPVAAAPAQASAACLADPDDLEGCAALDLANMRAAHYKWLNKKHYIRAVCRRLSIRVPRLWYAVLGGEAEVRAVAAQLTASAPDVGIYEVYDGVRYDLCLREDLATYFADVAARWPGRCVVRVHEYQLTDACGYAARTSDDGIVVETLPGMFGGFWAEGLQPTVYHIEPGALDAACAERVALVDRLVTLDRATLAPTLVRLEPAQPHRLAPAVRAQVARLCTQLTQALGEVRIEWVLCGEQVQFFDLSEESRPLFEASPAMQVLSAGVAAGPSCILAQIDTFDTIFDDFVNQIDVLPSEGFARIRDSAACKLAVERVLGSRRRPIVVAEYPKRTLAVLLDDVAGFVFERGSLLCHLAIILRERGIPAVILGDARAELSRATQIYIEHSQVLSISEE